MNQWMLGELRIKAQGELAVDGVSGLGFKGMGTFHRLEVTHSMPCTVKWWPCLTWPEYQAWQSLVLSMESMSR